MTKTRTARPAPRKLWCNDCREWVRPTHTSGAGYVNRRQWYCPCGSEILCDYCGEAWSAAHERTHTG